MRRRSSRASRSAPARRARAAASASPSAAAASSRDLAAGRAVGRRRAACQQGRDAVVTRRARRAAAAVTPSPRDGDVDVGAAGDQDTHGVDVALGVPSPRMIASCSAVQPRLLTWSTSMPARTSRPATSAWPRSAARISAGAVVGVLGVDVGAVASVRSSRSQVALAGRDQVRALHRVVLGVDVGAARDQAAGPLDVVVPGRLDQLGRRGGPAPPRPASARRLSWGSASTSSCCPTECVRWWWAWPRARSTTRCTRSRGRPPRPRPRLGPALSPHARG